MVSCCLNFNNSPDILVKIDTATPQKPYKMDKKYFMEYLGKDDSSRAVIRFFFHRRQWAKEYIIIPMAIAGTTALAFGIYEWISYGAQINFLWVIPITFIARAALTLGIIGTIHILRYSRKRLYKILERYNSGQGMPHKLMYKNSHIRKNIIRMKLNS